MSLNGKIKIQPKDRHIACAGTAGVRTQADSATLFDGFRYEGETGR